jgi:hypothetical protein
MSTNLNVVIQEFIQRIGLGHQSVGRVRGAEGVGRRFSDVGKGLFEKLAVYVRHGRWEGQLSFGEYELEDLGDRILRERFLLLYNRSLLPDPRDMLESWDCCWETFWLSVRS